MDKEFMKKVPSDMRPVTRFHGGFDPGTLSTARMIQVAKRDLGTKKNDPNIYICSEMHRCHIDGIQVEAGCTLGSGRLSVLDAGKTALVIYDAKKDRAWRFSRKKGAGSSSAVAKAVSGGRPRKEIKNIVESRAFDLCKMEPDEVVAYEEVKLAAPFKKMMLSGKFPEISKSYFSSVGTKEAAVKGREMGKAVLSRVGSFAGAKTASFAQRYGSYIRKVSDEVGKSGGKYDIFAISESRSELADVLQVMTDQTFGNRHLLMSGRNENAVTFVNRRTGEGVRLALDGRPTVERVRIKMEIKETFPVDRIDPCSSCGDMVFDGKLNDGKLCANCHKSHWKPIQR